MFVAKLFQDQDRSTLDSLNIKRPFWETIYPYFWVIDDDNGNIFADLGGRGDMPDHLGEPPSLFFLNYKRENYLYEVRYYPRVIEGVNGRVDVVVKIGACLSRGEEPEENVMAALTEALLENFKFLYRRRGVDYIRSVVI